MAVEKEGRLRVLEKETERQRDRETEKEMRIQDGTYKRGRRTRLKWPEIATSSYRYHRRAENNIRAICPI